MAAAESGAAATIHQALAPRSIAGTAQPTKDATAPANSSQSAIAVVIARDDTAERLAEAEPVSNPRRVRCKATSRVGELPYEA
jgi:hypothetical protein